MAPSPPSERPDQPEPQRAEHAKPLLSVGEATVVASRYDLAEIRGVRALPGGQTAKLETARGALVLKRRPVAMAERLHAAHGVVAALQARGIRVRRSLPARDGSTLVQGTGSLAGWVYDLTPWIDGERFDGSIEQARASGAMLGTLHAHLARIRGAAEHVSLSIHDRPGVAQALRTTGPAGHQAADMYQQACIVVGEQQPSTWTRQLVHGDWHRGNLLFEPLSDRIASILDFDEIGFAPALVEVVCGAVQFAAALPAGREQAGAHWASQTDPERVEVFIEGYRSSRKGGSIADALLGRGWRADRRQARVGAWIMAQSLLAQGAEIVLRGEPPGMRSDSGDGFVAQVLRKARWLVEHERWIADLLL